MRDLPDPRYGGRNPHGGWSRRGPNRVRRGDVQAAVLALLAESDMHGYQIIQELAERSAGAWRPGAGSIYPTLRQLQDQGLIRSRNEGSKRVCTITDYGRRAAQESGETEPWKAYLDNESSAVKLREATQALFSALAQVEQAGSEAQLQRAAAIVSETRRSIYLMLAEEDA